MGNRKMCKHCDIKRCDCAGIKPKNGMVWGSPCPVNTNSKCEIVAKKRKHIDWKGSIDKTVKSVARKKKMVKIKAYAFIGATTKAICVSSVEPFCANVPCVVIIKAKDAKWLKGEK